MKKTIAVILTCAMLFSAFSMGATARSGKLDETLAAETRALAVEIESEGAVLLKNEDHALPLDGKRVNAVYGGGDTMLTGIWSLQKSSHVLAMKKAYERDPVGFGAALRESVKHLCQAKMRTKAFLHPERTYDDSFIGSLDSPSEWGFSFPYLLSFVRYALNNLANMVIFMFRYIL